MTWVFVVSELGITALFLWCVYIALQAMRQDRGYSLSVLLSAACYAWIFEELNVLQGQGRGSYHYHMGFLVNFDRIPMFIVLAWAIILWTAMRLTNAAPISEPARVAGDATLAVLLDLAFDATAIRHGFWYWHGFSFTNAWFGVPAGNFFGWLYVSLAFSALTRGLHHLVNRGPQQPLKYWLTRLQLLLIPPLAFLLYRGVEHTTNVVLLLMGWTGDIPALAAFFVIFSITAVLAKIPGTPAQPLQQQEQFMTAWSRAAFHLFAIVGLFVLPSTALLKQQRPVLLLIAGLVWMGDWFYQRWLGIEEQKI